MFSLDFLPIEYCEERKELTNYPSEDGLEFILLTNDGRFLHYVSIMSYEDTPSGQEWMLVIAPFDDSVEYVEYNNCIAIAYIPRNR